jgi:hypothetical protein
MNRYAMGTALCLALGVAPAGSARADDAPGDAAASYAKELFEKADAAMRNTPPDYDAACEGFKKAYEIAHGLGALKKQAVCEEARGKLATALALWNEAVEQPQAADRKAESQKQVSDLDGKVGRLRVHPPSAGAHVSVDGNPWPAGEAKPIDPGSHRVVFEVVDRDGHPSTQSVDVTVTNGTTATAHPSEAAGDATRPALPPAQAPDASDSRSKLRAAGWTVGGLGVASFIAFGVTGGLSLSTQSALRDACTNHGTEPYSGCNADAPSLVSKGTALNVANAVSLGVGIAAVGVAIPLLFVGYKDAPATRAVVVPWVDQHSAGIVAGGGF